MKKKYEGDLENPENWDFEHIETREPVKSTRVVVSVAFSGEDFATVSHYAEGLGKKASQFIREASLEKAQTRGLEIIVHDFGSTGPLWFERNLPSSTRVYTLVKEQEMHETSVTS